MWIIVQAYMLLYADKWLDYTRTIHIALKYQMWLTVQAQMLLYADKWLNYTWTIHIALKLLKNERWLFKDY